MPQVPFDTLPDDARLWVFGSSAPLDPAASARLLGEVDAFLRSWAAHGSPLRSGRDWRDDHFLAIGVDQSTAGASGCSIDGLFRSLRLLERELGTTLLGGGRVFYRDPSGTVRVAERDEFGDLAAAGMVGDETPVFDTTVGTVGEWRALFERQAAESWHAGLLR
jgi:hypothetical protein